MIKQPLRVLLIEDDPRDTDLIQVMLAHTQRVACEVECADHLASGLSRLGRGGIDIALLDLSLPDSPGLPAFQAMHAQAPATPIIVLSDLDNEAAALEAVHAGALDYLIKDDMDTHVVSRVMRYGLERQRMLAELDQARRDEQHLAYHDVLTGLPNRQLFYDRLQQTLAHAKRHQHLAAVLFLDLDGFKRINDTLGHSTGDRLLQTTAQRLRTCTRESDTIARLGGDEFTAILADLIQEQDAARVAEKILQTLSEPYTIDGQELFVTTSIVRWRERRDAREVRRHRHVPRQARGQGQLSVL